MCAPCALQVPSFLVTTPATSTHRKKSANNRAPPNRRDPNCGKEGNTTHKAQMTRTCTCAHCYRTILPAITGRFTPFPGSQSSTFGGDAVSRGQSCDEGKTTGAGGRRGRGGDHVVCGIALAHPHADRRGPSPHPLPERRDRLPAHRGRQPIFSGWRRRRAARGRRDACAQHGGALVAAAARPCLRHRTRRQLRRQRPRRTACGVGLACMRALRRGAPALCSRATSTRSSCR